MSITSIVIVNACYVYNLEPSKLTRRLEELKEQGISRDGAIDLLLKLEHSHEIIVSAVDNHNYLDVLINEVTEEYNKRRQKRREIEHRRELAELRLRDFPELRERCEREMAQCDHELAQLRGRGSKGDGEQST